MNLKNAILAEVRCRPTGMPVAIDALVEDYGIEVLAALKQMRQDGSVRLVAGSCTADFTHTISGMDEIFVMVAMPN